LWKYVPIHNQESHLFTVIDRLLIKILDNRPSSSSSAQPSTSMTSADNTPVMPSDLPSTSLKLTPVVSITVSEPESSTAARTLLTSLTTSHVSSSVSIISPSVTASNNSASSSSQSSKKIQGLSIKTKIGIAFGVWRGVLVISAVVMSAYVLGKQKVQQQSSLSANLVLAEVCATVVEDGVIELDGSPLPVQRLALAEVDCTQPTRELEAM
jgi:hypothetical protein